MPSEWNSLFLYTGQEVRCNYFRHEYVEERKKQVNFAGPYGVSGQVILVKNENNDPIETLEDLKGKVIGTIG